MEVNQIEKASYQASVDPEGYGLSEKEATKRRKKVSQLKDRLKELEGDIQQRDLTLDAIEEADAKNWLLGDDGEYEDTWGHTTQKVL